MTTKKLAPLSLQRQEALINYISYTPNLRTEPPKFPSVRLQRPDTKEEFLAILTVWIRGTFKPGKCKAGCYSFKGTFEQSPWGFYISEDEFVEALELCGFATKPGINHGFLFGRCFYTTQASLNFASRQTHRCNRADCQQCRLVRHKRQMLELIELMTRELAEPETPSDDCVLEHLGASELIS
jgi:hypothetical protein